MPKLCHCSGRYKYEKERVWMVVHITLVYTDLMQCQLAWMLKLTRDWRCLAEATAELAGKGLINIWSPTHLSTVPSEPRRWLGAFRWRLWLESHSWQWLLPLPRKSLTVNITTMTWFRIQFDRPTLNLARIRHFLIIPTGSCRNSKQTKIAKGVWFGWTFITGMFRERIGLWHLLIII